MNNQPHNWDDEWTGLEPRSIRSRSWGCWVATILLLLVLIGACAGGMYYGWQRLGFAQQAEQLLTPPTAIPNEEAASDAVEMPLDSNTPSFAPTATLAAQDAGANIEGQRLTFEPVIDGDLQEWQAVPAYESHYLVHQVAGWDGSDDLAASWRLGWDPAALYVAVTVEDDRHVQTQTGNQIFRGDSVSLQIDSNREADLGPTLNSDDFQINLSPGDFAAIPPSAYRFRGRSDGSSSDAPGHQIRVAARQTEQGYNLEAVIPWTDIAINPSPGLTIGLALNANDNDTPGTAVQEVMKSHVATRQFGDPTSWGTLTLR